MRPSKLKPGDCLSIRMPFSGNVTAYFVKRRPAAGGRPAVNQVRIPADAGLTGPDDDGTCEMSDYDISRRGERCHD